MALALRSVYELVDGVLDEGLPYACSYLERVLNRPITVTDHNGLIHYPDMSANFTHVDDLFCHVPSVTTGKSFFYDELNRCLFFPVECNDNAACIIVKELPAKLVSRTVSILSEAKLAIKCYFSNLKKSNRNQEKFEKELADYLFFKSNTGLRDIIKLSEKDLDLHSPYFVALLEADEAENKIDWPILRSYSREYLRMNKFDIIQTALPDCHVLIIPIGNPVDVVEVDSGLSKLLNGNRFKATVENRFNIITSLGIGQQYPLKDLSKSFFEARIAITLPRLIGKRSFLQEFSRLGIYTLIFSQDIATIKDYCNKSIGQIIEFDKKGDGELLPTLRKLLDSSINWKATSESLFIHVNTLHYRVKKIEQLLKVDLSAMDTRSNLFTAIKVWDSLKTLGYWD